MADATLQTIEAAIFTTLQRQLTTNGGKFAAVERYVGQESGRERDKELAVSNLAGTPGLLVAPAGETYALGPGMSTAALQQHAFIGTSLWHVFVVHTEVAGHEQAVAGLEDSLGILELVSLAVSKLAGLRIPNLYRNKRLEPVDTRPAFIRPGIYVYLCRFRAERLVDSVPIVDDSQPFEELGGTVTSFPPGDDASDDSEAFTVNGESPFKFEISIEQDE